MPRLTISEGIENGLGGVSDIIDALEEGTSGFPSFSPTELIWFNLDNVITIVGTGFGFGADGLTADTVTSIRIDHLGTDQNPLPPTAGYFFDELDFQIEELLAAFDAENSNPAAVEQFLGSLDWTIIANDGDDVFTAGAVSNDGISIRLNGNDNVDLGDGLNNFFAAAGNDTVVGGADSDTINGGSGEDSVMGLGGADDLRGGLGDDTLLGDGGDDTILGQGGNDLVNGGADNDLLSGGSGADDLFGAEGDDTLNGGADDDRLVGGDGADRLLGGGGADRFRGGEGDDTMAGGAGDDLMLGDGGADRLGGGAGNDRMRGGDGTDRLQGNAGNDAIEGGAGDDYLNGGSGNDVLAGDGGNDILIGGAGNDTLVSGLGSDRLIGQLGADTFVLRQQDGAATSNRVMDFTLGEDSIMVEIDLLSQELETTQFAWGTEIRVGDDVFRVIGLQIDDLLGFDTVDGGVILF